MRIPRLKSQFATAVLVDDVLNDAGTFAQCDSAIILDERRSAYVVAGNALQRLRGQKRISGICDKLVVDSEFLAKPNNTLALRDAEVVDGQHFVEVQLDVGDVIKQVWFNDLFNN